MITKRLDRTLTTPDTVAGHWRFRGNLDGYSFGSTLENFSLPNGGEFGPGITEEGLTALNTTGGYARVPSADAGYFEMYQASFTLEGIFRHGGVTGNIVHKHALMENDHRGYYIRVTVAGGVEMDVGDANGNFVTLQVTTLVNDGRWHYVAGVVDRENGMAYLYLDGVEEDSGSIAHFTGDIGYDLNSLRVGGCGWIDEVCVSHGSMSAMLVASRHAGRMQEVSPYKEGFLMQFLPAVNHDNQDLKGFLLPLNTQYRELTANANRLATLMSWHECPSKYLSQLAALFGFPLIDRPYATDAERRNLLANMIWIYQRKGTLPAIEKILELLGFGHSMTEVYSEEHAFVSNLSMTWSGEQVLISEFVDDFTSGNLSKWQQPLNLDAWWRVIGSSLYGTGNGSDDDTNGILFADDKSVYRMEISYALFGGSTLAFGLYLSHQNANNWVRLELWRDGSNQDWLTIRQKYGSETFVTIGEVTELDVWSGAHILWVFADHDNEGFSAGIDEITVKHNVSLALGDQVTVRKGLWVNNDTSIAFGSVRVEQRNPDFVAKTFDPDMFERKVQIQLTGTPQFESNKRDYLKKILPDFLPAGVEIEWLT